MKDTIYRQDAINAIDCDIVITGRKNAELVAETIAMFADRIKSLPSAEKTGKWVSQVGGGCYCSKCGRSALHDVGEKFTLLFTKSNYCPWCGAKMEVDDG